MELRKKTSKALSRAFILLAIFSVVALVSCSKGPDTNYKDAASLRGGETGVTLPPGDFTGEVAMAYEAAKEIPDVLDSLYCYCDCEKHMGHKSLLTCYTTEHAAHCDICIDEALMAKRMHDEGADILTIRKAIDKKFYEIREQRRREQGM